MNFLVAYDISKPSEHAIEFAKEYARIFNAKIHILSSTPYGPELETEEYETLRDALEKVEKSCQDDKLNCETHLITRSLSAGEDLIEFAKRKNIDKIILGIRKRSKIGKLLMGSTAQHVILEANCPVIVVK